MKIFFFLLLIIGSIFPAWAQRDSSSAHQQASFVIRYRPLLIWNGIGMGYYLHPNHSLEVYGTGQATIELLDAQLVLERSVILEYRYYAINRKKTRWFVAPYFKHGRGDIAYFGDEDPEWRKREYLKDNALGMSIGLQFHRRYKRKGISYAEVFASPQYIIRKYYSSADLQTGIRQTSTIKNWGFVQFGINFCYDFYRKSR
jgi:hypothetical protein